MDWRQKQKTFFLDKNFEFQQDQRILDWAKNNTVNMQGDVTYFKDKLAISEDSDNFLCIINHRMELQELFTLLKSIYNKQFNRICISINKFLLYTNIDNEKMIDNYDQSLEMLVKSIFFDYSIKYFFVPELKGKHFNFASPTSQFFLVNERLQSSS